MKKIKTYEGLKPSDNHYLRPVLAARRFCLGCCLNQSKEVELCPILMCELYPYRFGHGNLKLKLIKSHCWNCSGYELDDVKNCKFPQCSLYPYRLEKNPNRKGIKKKAQKLHTPRISV